MNTQPKTDEEILDQHLDNFMQWFLHLPLKADWDNEEKETLPQVLDEALDTTYHLNSRFEYESATILLEYGGPNTVLDTKNEEIRSYWGGVKQTRPVPASIIQAVDNYIGERCQALKQIPYEPYKISADIWRNKNGQRHRDVGPAATYYRLDGSVSSEAWCQDDKLHRDGGPARIDYREDGSVKSEEWWQHGVEVPQPQPPVAEASMGVEL